MKRRRKAPDRVSLPYEIPESRCFVFRPGRGVCRAGAGRDLSRQRAGDRPFEPPPRGLCRRGAGRAGAEGSLDRLAGEVPHRAREAGHLAAGGLVGGLQEPHDARIHGLGRHALYRSRAGGGCRAAGGRDGPSVAVPRHGGESRKFEGDRPAGDREKPRLEPRRVAHRALVSRRGLLARGVSQRFDRARRRACGEQVLHGRDRNPEHQPFRHAGGDGRSGEHRQRRPRARNQFLYGRFSRRPGRGVEFRAGLQAPRRQCRKADLQSDVGRLGSGVERQRAHRRQDDLSVFHPPVLPATAVQTAGAALPAQLHRRAGESQDTPFGARRADGAGPCGIRQHASQRRREGRGRRIPVELPAPYPAGDLHGGGFVASLCGPPRADRDLEPQLPEQPQPEIPAQR